jgi:anti-sigma B factor antagonist
MSHNATIDVVQLSGELDIDRREEVASALGATAPPAHALIDLSEVTYADSTVISELLAFRNRTERDGRRTAILVGSPRLSRVLEYAGLSDAFSLFDDRESALRFLHGTA